MGESCVNKLLKLALPLRRSLSSPARRRRLGLLLLLRTLLVAGALLAVLVLGV